MSHAITSILSACLKGLHCLHVSRDYKHIVCMSHAATLSVCLMRLQAHCAHAPVTTAEAELLTACPPDLAQSASNEQNLASIRHSQLKLCSQMTYFKESMLS